MYFVSVRPSDIEDHGVLLIVENVRPIGLDELLDNGAVVLLFGLRHCCLRFSFYVVKVE